MQSTTMVDDQKKLDITEVKNKNFVSQDRSNSPGSNAINSHRHKMLDRERMMYLSQPKKLYVSKKKKRKGRRKLLAEVEESLLLPRIVSPTSMKTSLINVAKAKIYGIDLSYFPDLKEEHMK